METNVFRISGLAMVECQFSRVLVNSFTYRTVLVEMHLDKNEHERGAMVDTGFMSCCFPV